MLGGAHSRDGFADVKAVFRVKPFTWNKRNQQSQAGYLDSLKKLVAVLDHTALAASYCHSSFYY